MKAIVVHAPGSTEVMRLCEVPAPDLRSNEVLIQVGACGVCFHDVVTRNGVLRRGITMPLIPGHEVSGIVTQVGTDVQRIKPGAFVATAQRRHICGTCDYCRNGRETSCAEREFLGDSGLNGGYAEYVAVDESNVCEIPEGVELDHASIAGCAIATELNAVRDVACVRPGDTVLVTGAGGGIGIHAVQLARLAGGFVIAVTSSPEKVEIIASYGAHKVIAYERNCDFSEAVKDATGGRGVDVAVDNVGSATFDSVRRSLALGGRWVFVGQLTGEFVKLNPAQVFLNDISIRGVRGASRTHLRDALRLIQRREIRPVISAVFPLEQAATAHQEVESGRSVGRVLLRP